jgi:hypothetical protein
MKTKLPLYLAIVVCMLVSAIAFPVLAAGDPIPMWVSRARLAYVGRSSTGPDAVVGMIHIRDATKAKVAGATVTAEWTLPGGTVFQETAPTDSAGIARFSEWVGQGDYRLCVIDATKAGWLYDPTLDRESCSAFRVP